MFDYTGGLKIRASCSTRRKDHVNHGSFRKKLENLGMVYEIAKFVIVIRNLAEIFLGSRAEIWDRPSTRGRIGRKPVRGGGPAGRAGASGLGRSDFRAGRSDLGGSDFRSGAGEELLGLLGSAGGAAGPDVSITGAPSSDSPSASDSGSSVQLCLPEAAK